MKKNSKRIISIGSLALIALPIAVVASCSSPLTRTTRAKVNTDTQTSESPTKNIGPEHKLQIDNTHDLI